VANCRKAARGQQTT